MERRARNRIRADGFAKTDRRPLEGFARTETDSVPVGPAVPCVNEPPGFLTNGPVRSVGRIIIYTERNLCAGFGVSAYYPVPRTLGHHVYIVAVCFSPPVRRRLVLRFTRNQDDPGPDLNNNNDVYTHTHEQ